ncbi:hypothetical protein WJX79_009491 [Trebouxia sp. C0005]
MLHLSWVVLCALIVSTCFFSTRSQAAEDLPAARNFTGYVGTDPCELALCDCEVATGPPNGLSCEKEGWFVSSFEREGSWLTGGGLVPLSRASVDINCGETDNNRLLQGFERWRITALGLVPIAPAQCCKTCLSKTIHPLDSCSDLNFCSGHGVCNLGSCDCLDGFGGPDCSSQIGGGAGQLPQWATSLIIFGSCVLVTTLVLVAGRLVHHFADRHAEDEEDEEGLGEPLILRIDHDDQGSVGSEDTTGFDSDDDVPPVEAEAVGGGVLIPESNREGSEEAEVQSFVVPVANGIQLETRRRTRQQPTHAAQDVGVTDSEDEAETAEDLERIEAAAAAINQRIPQSPVAQLQDEIQETPDTASVREAPSGDIDDNDDDLIKDAKKVVVVGSQENEEDPTAGLLRGAECNVCMNRPVQVVAIPCGHACMCRRCSRRLQRCPVCRKEIVRRQRLFLGG